MAASVKDLVERFRQGPTDVVGVDLGPGEIRAVRMRKGDGNVSVVSVGVFPADASIGDDGRVAAGAAALSLPAKVRGRHVSIALSGQRSIIKLLSFPGQFDEDAESKIVDNMGLDNPDDFRVGYKLISEGRGKAESRILAVALPDEEAGAALGLFPSGLPAPFSVEVSGLATMTAFLNALGEQHKEDAVGIVDFGIDVSAFALLNKNSPVLVRQSDVCTNAVIKKVQETLGVDGETAKGIISDGSFDVSQSMAEVMEPLIKQLTVSRDFVERRENCHIAKMYVSGNLVISRDSIEEMMSALGMEIAVWNPFQGLTVHPNALPEELAGQEWRFAAAVGACLGTFEES